MNWLKTLIFTVTITTSLSAFGKKLFIHPYIGAGTTGIQTSGGFSGILRMSNTLGTTAGIQVGKSFSKLQLSVGVAVLNTGTKLTDPLILMDNNNPLGYDSIKMSYVYRHILIPVKAGFEIKVKKLSITPALAIAPSYNLGEIAKSESLSTGSTDTHRNETGGNTPNRTISVFGMASADVAYHINSRIAITAGPSMSYMLTNMINKTYTGPFTVSRKHYAITGNLGVVLKL